MSTVARVYLQLIETYIPQALDRPRDKSNQTTKLTEVEASTIINSECVADYIIFNPTNAYASTDFYFVEESLDSGIKPEQLGLHQSTKSLVLKLVGERGFQQDLGNGVVRGRV